VSVVVGKTKTMSEPFALVSGGASGGGIHAANDFSGFFFSAAAERV